MVRDRNTDLESLRRLHENVLSLRQVYWATRPTTATDKSFNIVIIHVGNALEDASQCVSAEPSLSYLKRHMPYEMVHALFRLSAAMTRDERFATHHHREVIRTECWRLMGADYLLCR